MSIKSLLNGYSKVMLQNLSLLLKNYGDVELPVVALVKRLFK